MPIANPRFSGKATITSDGFVMCNFTASNGENHMGAFVGSVTDLVRNTKGLGDHLKLSDDDRKEFYHTITNWIGMNYSGRDLGLEENVKETL